MNTNIHITNLSDQKKYSTFKKRIDKNRLLALRNRLKKEAFVTDMEYLSGAFLEMYEPYLKEIVFKLFEKGYAIETSSGFNSLNSQYQSLDGQFAIDYVTRNKLDKEGIKIRENDGVKSLVFWAENLDFNYIKQKWLHIIEMLPDKGKMSKPSESPRAVLFRRKYLSRNPKLQKKRLFERLEFKIKTAVDQEVKKRKKINPHPNNIESRLGIFIEELQPQVRQAVLEINRKGYSTDLSGCINDACDQMIEGDFTLTENIISKLSLLGVKVESNPSGYTRLLFSPVEADIGKIKKQWSKIVALLPSRNKLADFSMTKRSREFRIKYS